jgi:hypothetical protein
MYNKHFYIVLLSIVLFLFMFCSKNSKNKNAESKQSDKYISSSNLAQIDSIPRRDNKTLKNIPSIKPILHGTITKYYQEQSQYIYITAVDNASVFATGGGSVVKITDDPDSKLNRIIISHSKDYTTIYSNLINVKVIVGQVVHRWDIIGTIGVTGKSSKPFLKYEVLKGNMNVNPFDFMLDD